MVYNKDACYESDNQAEVTCQLCNKWAEEATREDGTRPTAVREASVG